MSKKKEKEPQFLPKMPDMKPLIQDVVGKAKEFLDELEINVNAEEIFKNMGTTPEKNFLLYGPPGCGKTLAVDSFNNTMNLDFWNRLVSRQLYGLGRPGNEENEEPPENYHGEEKEEKDKSIEIDPLEFDLITMPYDIGSYGTAYVNMGSKTVQSFFDLCFDMGYLGKKVLIAMDEFDSLGTSRKRSMESNHSEDRKVLETIMKNLQKAHDKENIYTILMTNEPEICDDAVLRAGRIDKKYFIGLPNEEERKIGFKKAVENINKRAGYSVIRGTNYDNLVELSEGFSYADIFQSVENSVKQRAKEIYESTADNTKKGVVNSNRLENIIKDHNDKFIKKDKNTIGFK